MSYTIELSDGTTLKDLEANGNNFIAPYEVTPDTFKGKLSRIAISGEGSYSSMIQTGIYANMELIQITHGEPYQEPGEWWFVLAEIPRQEVRMRSVEDGVDVSYDAIAELGTEIDSATISLDDIMTAIAELGVRVEEVYNG